VLDYYESSNREAARLNESADDAGKEDASGKNRASGKDYSLKELEHLDLLSRKPSHLEIGGTSFAVRSWADVCVRFVGWLYENGHLKETDIPVYNHAERDKFFINSKPRHKHAERDGAWKKVGPFYVDVKYTAEHNVRNIRHTINHIGGQNFGVRIGLD
jgi:hypothetical protein